MNKRDYSDGYLIFQPLKLLVIMNRTEWLEPGGHFIGKTGDGYIRAITVPFFIPQKSLKGLQIHRLVPQRVLKSLKSRISLKGSHFSS